MKRFLSILLCVAILAQPAMAQTEDIKGVGLDVPKSFARDSKILFKLDGLQDVKARVKWWVRSDDGRQPPDFEVFDSGLTCAIWAKPGKYEALITVGVIADDITWHDFEHKFTVGGTPDDPVDPPDDPIDPDDPVKPYDFGDVTALVVSLCGPVNDTKKEEAAKIIASAYKKHGELAKNSQYADQNVLADATSADFVNELGLNRYVKWRPVMTRLRTHMSELMASGKLKDKDMAAWSALWLQYAAGFESVKGGTNGASN